LTNSHLCGGLPKYCEDFSGFKKVETMGLGIKRIVNYREERKVRYQEHFEESVEDTQQMGK